MLITFKSEADGDVIMFGEIGQRMLSILGKDPSAAAGIVTVAQLPDARAALREAIERDKIDHPPQHDVDEWGQDSIAVQALREKQRDQAVSLAQRAAPLLQMLECAERAGVVVTWGA